MKTQHWQKLKKKELYLGVIQEEEHILLNTGSSKTKFIIFIKFIPDKSISLYIIVKMIFPSFGNGNLLMMFIYITYGKYTKQLY